MEMFLAKNFGERAYNLKIFTFPTWFNAIKNTLIINPSMRLN